VTQVHFFEEADEEVEERRRWYREQSETAEAAFLRELDHAVGVVLDAPRRWPQYIAGTQRYVFSTFPYSLVYFVENETIQVVAVAHQKRRPGYWLKRLRS
jgi:plasmid stabilization system protein ParE